MKTFVAIMILISVLAGAVDVLSGSHIICQDRSGNKIGSIRIESDQEVIFLDRAGNRLGRAKQVAGKTLFYDRHGNKQGECMGTVVDCAGCMGIEAMEKN